MEAHKITNSVTITQWKKIRVCLHSTRPTQCWQWHRK